MKQLIFISLSIFFIGVVSFWNSTTLADTQVVVCVDGLDMKLQTFIERELSGLNGVDFCESSLMTRTIILNIDDSIVSEKDLIHTLKKWGINAKEFHYSKLHLSN